MFTYPVSHFGARRIITLGLEFHFDPGHVDSYPGTGQTWFDLTANNYDLQLGDTSGAEASDPTFTGSAGSLTAYWAFDGGDRFEWAAHSGSLMRLIGRTDTAFTFECFVYFGDSAGTQAVFTNAFASGENGVYLEYDNVDQRIGLRALDPGATSYDFGSTHAAAQWLHVVWFGKLDGSTTCGFYVNNVAGSTFTHNSSGFTTGDSTQIAWIGNRADLSLPLRNGSRLGPIRGYSRILTAAEISNNWNAQRARYGL